MFSHIWTTRSSQKSQEFLKSSVQLKGIVSLLWREHCMECAMPLCYKSCRIYKKRMDGRCVRFENGIVPIQYNDGVIGGLISFNRWAKLQSFLPGRLSCKTIQRYKKRNYFLYFLELNVRRFCDVLHWYRPCQIVASLDERINAHHNSNNKESANNFYICIKNHENKVLSLILEILSGEKSSYRISVSLEPGWNEQLLPISSFVMPTSKDASQSFIRCYLDKDDTGTIEFRYFDFVKTENMDSPKPAKKVKCIAWDLDNTLWEGVIGDDGIDGISLNKRALRAIKALDERGIIQTVISKNTYDIAWPAIEKYELKDYFLYPAINWGRKSQNLAKIAKELNINIDSVGFVDDSGFEREEMKASFPQVRVYDAKEIDSLLDRPEFDVVISDTTRKRRQSYLMESHRKTIRASWDGDYDSFLKSCEMKMNIFVPEGKSVIRCHELLSRSNQYNTSGNRYSINELNDLLSHSHIENRAFSLKDKYGDYGIIGFCSYKLDARELYIIDFVMSCRAAGKKVERAFLNEIAKKYPDISQIVVMINKTDRNMPLQDEFKKIPFVEVTNDGEILKLRFNALKVASLDEQIINVHSM